MLLLCFEVRSDHYALDSASIAEVIPWIDLRIVPHAAAYLVGLAHYRGQVVPVLDVGVLLDAPKCEPRLSTRIIIVRSRGSSDGSVLLGLLAERVNDVWRVPSDVARRPMLLPDPLRLGPIYERAGNLLQVIEIERLLPRFDSPRLLERVGAGE